MGGVTCRQLCRLRRRRSFTNKFLFTKRVWGLVKNRMEESDPDPAVAAGQRSSLLENIVRGEEQVVNAECNSSGMEIEFATWKGTSTGPSPGCSSSGSSSSSISARTTISKFSTESENVKVYVKRKSRDAGGVHLFESPLKKQNVDSLAGGSKDAVLMVEPLRTPTSMPPLEAVHSETSQDMVVNVNNNNNNNNRQNVTSNQYVTRFPASVVSS